MKRIYDTGIDSNQIKCTVKIGTVGVAYSAIYKARTGGQWAKIKESSSNSGNIRAFTIGKAVNLKSSYLIIRTIIDFSNIDESLWKNQQDNVVARYGFSGGFSGSQTYNGDTDDITSSPKGKIIVITKPIQLI